MATPERPVLLDRALSTPPITPKSDAEYVPIQPLKDVTNLSFRALTPPTSPRPSKISARSTARSCLDIRRDHLLHPSLDDLTPQITAKTNTHTRPRGLAPRECPFNVEIVKDSHGREQIFGTGAWSTVYRAAAAYKRTSLTPNFSTPPLSSRTTMPVLLAVKRPTFQDAKAIVKSEGSILSYLASIREHENHVVRFYGVLAVDGSLVLAACPFSLEDHVRKCAAESKIKTDAWTMSEPVVGSTKTWLSLASRLIDGLVWLHGTAGVVHGDIKPANILLSPTSDAMSEFLYDPLFADFSSGQLLGSDVTTNNTLSAITTEYCAPELLSSKVLTDPNATATTASDVFSLAVTLLAAATGELMIYTGIALQRQAMARQGWYVISHAQNGAQGAKVPRYGIVAQVLERAVLKIDMGRISAQHWQKLIDEKVGGGPAKQM